MRFQSGQIQTRVAIRVKCRAAAQGADRMCATNPPECHPEKANAASVVGSVPSTRSSTLSRCAHGGLRSFIVSSVPSRCTDRRQDRGYQPGSCAPHRGNGRGSGRVDAASAAAISRENPRTSDDVGVRAHRALGPPEKDERRRWELRSRAMPSRPRSCGAHT
jgi:hypothetical protein